MRTSAPARVFLIVLLLAACSVSLCIAPSGESGAEQGGEAPPPEETAGAEIPPSVTFDPAKPRPVRLIFIHHSTGENWLADENGGLGTALMEANYFVSDTNYGWGPSWGPENVPVGDMTDTGQWWIWFRSPESEVVMNRVYQEDGQHSVYTRFAESPGEENEIVIFKSCFPNSALQGGMNDPVPPIGDNPLKAEGAWSEHHTVANAKGIYLDLLGYFRSRPDKLFIIVTAPPLSDGKYAANARAFNTWLVNDYLDTYDGKNVFVYDFYNVMTSNGGGSAVNDAGRESGNHHRIRNGAIQHVVESGITGTKNTAAYASGWDDDHPTMAGNRKATAEFVPVLDRVYAEWKAGRPAG